MARDEAATAACPAGKLVAFATSPFRAAGLEDEKALTVAELLVEGALLGHTTLGLALAAPYLEAALAGGMKRGGERRAVWRPRGAVHAHPMAVAIPTGGAPILIDMSASITTNGMTARRRAEGRRPGEQRLARRRRALARGIRLCPGIMASLRPLAAQPGVAAPAATA